MSKPYKEYKVNELKDLLKERGLSPSGTKSELINRLEEADASKGGEEPAAGDSTTVAQTEPTEAPVEEAKSEAEPEAETTESNSKPAAESGESVGDATEDKKEEPKPPKEEAPKLSDEELLSKFKAEVSAKIERTKRFGGDASELEARLRRIEKFGISAVRDAAEKAKSSAVGRQRGNPRRKNRNRKQSGPKPATA